MNKKCFLRLYVKWADLGFVNRIDNVQQAYNGAELQRGPEAERGQGAKALWPLPKRSKSEAFKCSICEAEPQKALLSHDL